MPPARSSIGYPWILDAIKKYNGESFMLKPAPAQVVEFLKMPERTEECQFPGAVVHISDRQYYIRAIITREAQETLEREDEHFTLAHIKNKIVILKKCTLSFAAEEDPRRCEFYLTIQHFCILAMEINTVDLLNCNMEPGVRKKIEELWQLYMKELQQTETMSDMNLSDISLTQLLMIASEERLADLKSLAEQCLDLDTYATQEIAPQARTIWSAEIRNNKSNNNSFSIPINLLLISPEEELALEQMSEFRPDVNSDSDVDNEGSDSSQQYNSAKSTLSQEPMDDACNSEPKNPWDNLQSLLVSGSLGSGSEPATSQQNSEKEPAADADTTPDILRYHQDKSLSDSSESQDEISPLDLSKQSSHQIQPEANISTSTNHTGDSSSNFAPHSNQRRLSDCSQSLLSLKPLAQHSLNHIHTSPQGKVAVKNDLPGSHILSHGSESKLEFKIIRNISPIKSRRYKGTDHSPREWKAVKRKQAPEDLDTIFSDLEQQASVHTERPDCAPDLMSTANYGTQTDSKVQERGNMTNDSCMNKKQSLTEQVNKTANTETAVTCGITSLRKKALPYKPSLEFVTKLKTKVENELPAADLPTTSRTGCKSSRGQTSSCLVLLEMKNTLMTHCDGKPFQYKYKPPSAALSARVKSVRIPPDLREWAVKIISKAKDTDP
ncbi:adrenocortical dysplasia protein homolog isoform X2 [Pyxicephalus adspersus]|uniref:Shelterin complex subunit TPP1/Est3 domain-containing protein n=1 Tax=Pyxicephalus adspersus TaxID=30357 RepID=A0AAV3AH25_PYXAD|nr:TPA: hypothetical protein GDO54_012234 [Pyxicephalus adspersus]